MELISTVTHFVRVKYNKLQYLPKLMNFLSLDSKISTLQMKIFIFLFIFLLNFFYIYLLKDNNESNYYPNPFALSILVVVFYGVESDSTCIILQFD